MADLPKSLSAAQRQAVEAWARAGTVKRRWMAFVGGVICGGAGAFVCMTLFGCSHSNARPVPPATTAVQCVPGPVVID